MKHSVMLLTTTLALSTALRADPTTLVTLDTLKAFPTAEGAGANVSGGRGGKVIYVKNRNRSGPDSLHDALKDAAILPAKNARTIVFAIGGRFDLSDGIFLGYLKAKKQGGSNRGENLYNNFTLAGQTAWDKGGVHMATEGPNGPLREKGAPELGVYGQENMILRYFDTRYNWEWYVARNELGKQPSIRFVNSSDFIVDHMTSGWSSYGLIATNGNKNFYYDKTVDNISVQRSLFHENIIDPTTTKPQKNHNVGLLLGVSQSDNELEDWNKVGTFSIHKNAFIGVSHRFPNMAGSENAKLNFTNNFIHGFNGGGVKRLGRTAGNTHHDFINNTFQKTLYSPPFSSENLIALDYKNFLSEGYPLENVTPNFHIDGNLFLSNTEERLDITDDIQNSNGRDMLFVWVPEHENQVDMPRLVLRDGPNPSPEIAVSTLNANDLKANILNNVGGNVRFSSDGSTNIDNPIDAEYIRWAVQNDAPTTLTSSLGDGGIGDRDRFEHPAYNTEKAVNLDEYDSDKDGMPNDWEEEHHLTVNSVIDDTDLANNENNLVRENRDWIFDDDILVRNNAGYTNLEMYLADVAGDFHMLAQSEGTPIVTVKDDLKHITINDLSLILDNTVAARIEYSTATDRQIKCYLQTADAKETIAFTKVDVSAGSDTAECNLELPSPLIPTRLYVYITTIDGKWSNRFDEIITPIEIPAVPVSISDQLTTLKAASWSQVSDRSVRITANAPLAKAMYYNNIAQENYRQGKHSIGNRFSKLTIASLKKFKAVLERGVSKNKFPASEIKEFLDLADATIALSEQEIPTLFIKSSFDGIIIDRTVSWNHHLAGVDSTTGFTFPDDLPGNNSEDYFNYLVSDTNNYSPFVDAKIDTTTGADGNPTQALYIEFKQDDPNKTSRSRVQYVITGDETSSDPVQRMNKGYVKYKIKKHLDDVGNIDWELPFELKDTDDIGFRVGLYLYGTSTPNPYWVAKGQYMINGNLGDNVWQQDNHTVQFNQDEWFELEVYWLGSSDSQVGRFKVAIDGEIVFDITNQTKDPLYPDRMFYFMPFKVYGAKSHSWITDFEYWDDIPVGSVLSN